MEVDLFGIANPESQVMKLDKFSSCRLKEHNKMKYSLLKFFLTMLKVRLILNVI